MASGGKFGSVCVYFFLFYGRLHLENVLFFCFFGGKYFGKEKKCKKKIFWKRKFWKRKLLEEKKEEKNILE